MKLKALVDEYRSSIGVVAVPDFDGLLRREQRRKRNRWMGVAAGIAASVALCVGLWPVNVVVPQPVASVRPVQALPEVQEVAPVKVVIAASAKPARKSYRAPKVTPIDDGFVAIAATGMLPRPDVIQVLRVNVSGDRLLALGALRPNQLVSPMMEADVLVGDDGVARAIRVVSYEE